LGIHVFLAIIGIVKKGVGVGGFLGDENDFCMTMNMIIPFSFFLAMNASGKKKIFYIILVGLFLFVIILTNSRGGFVGLLAAFTYCWLRTKRKVLMAFIIGFLAVFAVIIAPPTYWDRIHSITEEGTDKGTGEERVYTWKIGWKMFLDNPILGVGQGNFPYVFRKYEIKAGHGEEGYHGRSVSGRQAHSIYITMLSELGIIGTCIFIGIIINMFNNLKTIKVRSFYQKKKVSAPIFNSNYFLALALEGSLVAYLVSGAFISVLYYPNLWVLMGFIVSLKRIVFLDLKPVTT
jgi:O-antigen ligase